MAKEKQPVGKPPRADKNNKTVPSAEKWTIPGDMRKTYIVKVATADKIEEIAHIERKPIKAVVEEAFTGYVEKYEKINGEVKAPKRK